MSSSRRSWDDLRPRVVTGLALAVAGAIVVGLGGIVFALTAALVTAVMIWELTLVLDPMKRTEALQAAALAAAAILLARALPGAFAFPILAAAALAGAWLSRPYPKYFAIYAFAILIGVFALVLARHLEGAAFIVWLVLTVVATDIAGYFAGRAIGGPKFWPAISPKKTWAGVIAGWIAAFAVAVGFVLFAGASLSLLWLGPLLSFVSQMGDFGESFLKRRMGVKDASALLPGHGGALDRFDGLMAAAIAMLVLGLVLGMGSAP